MIRQFLLLLLTWTIVSCGTGTRSDQEIKTTKAIVNADSCKKWGLQTINFELAYPENYIAEYNVRGGYYLILHKMNGDTVLQEIGFGKPGDLTVQRFSDNLNYIDSLVQRAVKSYGQEYKNDFLGRSDFFGEVAPQIRATVNYTNLQPEGQSVILNGTYSTVLTCVNSKRDSLEIMTISVMSNLREPYNSQNRVSLTSTEILKTLKVY